MSHRQPRAPNTIVGLPIEEADLLALAESDPGSTLVDRIFALVSSAIQSRKAVTGARMPSVRQLAESCRISRDTAARAYDKLVAHGLLESRRGSGYFVKAASAPARRGPDKAAQRFSLFHPDGLNGLTSLRLRLQRQVPGHVLQSQSGIGTLPESWLNEPDIAGALRSVARGNQRGLAATGDPQGYLPLRQQLQLKLQDVGVHLDPAQLILTSGATDAINAFAAAFLRRVGDAVLVEQPCQPILIDRLRSVGLEVYTVPREADGPDLDTLRSLCVQYKPSCFFVGSALHNPTSWSLPAHKAFQLLRLAEEFNLVLVEDDTYGDLLPGGGGGGTAVTRLAALDQLQRVVLVGSFSKTIAPGLRVGYVAASPERVEWMAAYRALNCLATNSLAERTVYQLLSQGNYRRHCEQLRARLAELRPRATKALQKLGLRLPYEPDAGFYLWADLGDGVDAFAVARRLLAEGHLTAPGPLFSLAHPSYMRFNIATMLEGDALPALARALDR